ncbi:hypothetical protein DM860_018149 [Cuscuta australis]|uniref:Replication factor A C-terminal domain-containing protein n=1 Tax=Cuscuta australis TaxID=267555 RepID=A0A328DJ66_9ASTE|nr:hypothetical protein DM860_018149 [Cuscuta australis]
MYIEFQTYFIHVTTIILFPYMFSRKKIHKRRYKVIVRVVDESGGGHATSVMFDKECTKVLVISAFLLREPMNERNLDPDTLPQELDGMVCEKALFKDYVRKQTYSPTKKRTHIFSVGRLVTDPKVLAKYKEVVERTTLDDLWDQVEDLSQTVGKIGSNDVFESQNSGTNSVKEILIEPNNPIKRRLFDESSTS